MKKILAIGIHVDDTEYSIGGTLKLLAEKGCDVTILNIIPNLFEKDRTFSDKQSIEAASLVGAKKIILEYNQNTKFYKTNEDTVRKVEEVIREVSPDILFIMYPEDNHIEHVECAKTTRESLFAAAVGKDKAVPNEIYSVECGPYQTMRYFGAEIYIGIDNVIDDVKASMMHFNQACASGDGLWKEKETAALFRGYEMSTCTANAKDGREVKYAEALRIEKYPFGNRDFLLRELLEDEFCWCSLNMYHPMAHPIFRG